MYMPLFLTLVSDYISKSTQKEKFWTFLLKSDVNLFNHLVRKADVAGCCSAVLSFVDMRLLGYSVSLICIV